MILGLLSEVGPMHGHQIRRTGELTNAEVWGGITGGAIYAELRRLQGEGLVEPVREEQIGRRPARTVYAITDEGHLELVVQREEALDVIFPSADPVSVALLFAAGVDSSELRRRLAARRQRIQAQLEAMAEERGRLTDAGVLSPMAITCFRRGEFRLDAELRWHDEFEAQYAKPAPRRQPAELMHPRPS
jgi:DNA-binding PadR family transcriptional regulator